MESRAFRKLRGLHSIAQSIEWLQQFQDLFGSDRVGPMEESSFEGWETETGLPLPLGLMVARRTLRESVVREAEQNLRQSIRLANKVIRENGHPLYSSLWNYIETNAIELEESTILSHIDLYVNEYSLELGEEGHAAVDAFLERAEKSRASGAANAH